MVLYNSFALSDLGYIWGGPYGHSFDWFIFVGPLFYHPAEQLTYDYRTRL